MKRFQSAFAAPSGFAVVANATKKAQAVRRTEAALRAGDISATPAKPRATRDIRDRAA